MPDLECTWWPDGVPAWLGGTGDEWLHCCVAHDLSDLPMLASDIVLARCVADAGHGWMAPVMLAGLVTLGVIYRVAARLFRNINRT